MIGRPALPNADVIVGVVYGIIELGIVICAPFGTQDDVEWKELH